MTESLFFPLDSCFRLEQDKVEVKVSSDSSGIEYTVTVIFIREESKSDCMPFYNSLFNRILTKMDFTRDGRNYFDFRAQSRTEIKEFQ